MRFYLLILSVLIFLSVAFCKKGGLSEIQNKDTLDGVPIHHPAPPSPIDSMAKAEDLLRLEREKSGAHIPEQFMPKFSKGPFEALHEHPELEDQHDYVIYKMTIPYDDNVDKVRNFIDDEFLCLIFSRVLLIRHNQSKI
jgi:hypothetical protein